MSFLLLCWLLDPGPGHEPSPLAARVDLSVLGDQDGVVGQEVGHDKLSLGVHLTVNHQPSSETKNVAVKPLSEIQLSSVHEIH